MAATCTDSLQPMAGTPCYFSVNGINNGRVGDIIKDYEANAVAAVLYAEQWDARVLIMLDRDFVFTMVEALLVGRGRTADRRRAIPSRISSFVWCRRCSSAWRRLCSRLRSDLRCRLQGRADRDRDGVSGDRAKQQHVDMRQYHAAGTLSRRANVLMIPHSALNPLRQKRPMSSSATASRPIRTGASR